MKAAASGSPLSNASATPKAGRSPPKAPPPADHPSTSLFRNTVSPEAFITNPSRSGRGHIANIGSVLGAIGLPHFAAYSASKFALRGFSEALRRELAGTGIGVSYIAPRTTRTAFNSDTLYALSAADGNAVDTPESVAAAIVDALISDRAETCIGWPEKLFVRLNALLPRLVDRALGRQTQVARRMLRDHNAPVR